MQSCEPVDKKRDPLFEYPWQAIPVALFKSLPGRHLDSLEVDECWSEDVTAKLREIMDKYDFFRVVPVCHAQKVNTYFEYARVSPFSFLFPLFEFVKWNLGFWQNSEKFWKIGFGFFHYVGYKSVASVPMSVFLPAARWNNHTLSLLNFFILKSTLLTTPPPKKNLTCWCNI